MIKYSKLIVKHSQLTTNKQIKIFSRIINQTIPLVKIYLYSRTNMI